MRAGKAAAMPAAGEIIKAADAAVEVSEKYLGGMPYSQEGVIARMTADLGNIQNSMIDLGMCGLALKEVAGHGKFQEIIKERFEVAGIVSLRTIQRAMTVADFIIQSGIKNDTVSFMTSLHSKKQILLAQNATPDDFDEEAGTVFDIPFADLRALSYRELKRKLEKAEDKIEAQKETIAQGTDQLAALRDELSKSRNLREWVGRSEEQFDRVLNDRFYLIVAQLELFDQEIKKSKSKLSTVHRAAIMGWYAKAMEVMENYGVGFKEMLNEACDPNAWEPDWKGVFSEKGEKG